MATPYAKTMEQIWEATDPDLDEGDTALRLARCLDNPALMSIWMARSTVAQIEGAIELADEGPHSVDLAEFWADTLRKHKKNTARLVSELAQYIDTVKSDCRCGACRAHAAPNN